MQEYVMIGIVGALLLVIMSLFSRKTLRPLGSTRTVRNAGYIDFSGGRLTQRSLVVHDHLEIKDVDRMHKKVYRRAG